MSSTTITLPTGDKVRLYSQRRYVVLARNGRERRWVPVYRTDVRERAIAKGVGYNDPYVVDQVERTYVRPFRTDRGGVDTFTPRPV